VGDPLKLTESEWLARRRHTIGASDVATICGLNPYKSPYRLWAEKTGKVEPEPASLPAKVGKALEPLIAQEYEERTGRVLVDPGDFTIYRHPEFSWLSCTPDRIAFEHDNARACYGAVEMKSIGEMAARDMKEDAKIEHQIQLQIQLACMELDRGDIIALIGNRKVEIFSFERHDAAITKALTMCQRFYENVCLGIEPAVDGTRSTAETLFLLHPDDNGGEVQFSESAYEAAVCLEETKKKLQLLEEQKTRFENILKQELGDNTFGQFLDTRYSFKTQERKGYCKVDLKHLDELEKQGFEPNVSLGSKFRVLRKTKATKF